MVDAVGGAPGAGGVTRLDGSPGPLPPAVVARGVPAGSLQAALAADIAESNDPAAAAAGPRLAAAREEAAPVATDTLLGSLRHLAANSVGVQELAQVMHKINLEMREASRQDREVARDAEIASLQAAAQKIRDSAALQLFGTIVSSGMAIGGAAISVKGAAKAQGKFDAEMAKPQPNAMVAQQLATQTTMTATGKSAIATEMGKIMAAGVNIAAADEQAKKAELEADATRARTLADDETEFKTAYEKAIADVLDKLAEMQRAQSESMRNIANMG